MVSIPCCESHEKSTCIFNCLVIRKKINSLGPSDAIWRWTSWSTLVQLMAWCLMAPSHYLIQCWLIISKVLWHSSEDIIIRSFEDTNQWSKIEDYIFKIILRSPRDQWVNLWPHDSYMCQWPESSLRHIMVCYLFGAKPLPEPIQICCQLVSQKQTSVKFQSNYLTGNFFQENNQHCLQAVGRFV